MLLDQGSKIRPPPRHSHSSAIHPNGSEIISGSTAPYAKHLIIFGGVGPAEWSDKIRPEGVHECQGGGELDQTSPLVSKTFSCDLKDLVPFNDLWIFSFDVGQWIKIVLQPSPSPRYGIGLVWLSSSSLILFGGEGRSSAALQDYEGDIGIGSPIGKREIYSDSWILQILGTKIARDKTITASLTAGQFFCVMQGMGYHKLRNSLFFFEYSNRKWILCCDSFVCKGDITVLIVCFRFQTTLSLLSYVGVHYRPLVRQEHTTLQSV